MSYRLFDKKRRAKIPKFNNSKQFTEFILEKLHNAELDVIGSLRGFDVYKEDKTIEFSLSDHLFDEEFSKLIEKCNIASAELLVKIADKPIPAVRPEVYDNNMQKMISYGWVDGIEKLMKLTERTDLPEIDNKTYEKGIINAVKRLEIKNIDKLKGLVNMNYYPEIPKKVYEKTFYTLILFGKGTEAVKLKEIAKRSFPKVKSVIYARGLVENICSLGSLDENFDSIINLLKNRKMPERLSKELIECYLEATFENRVDADILSKLVKLHKGPFPKKVYEKSINDFLKKGEYNSAMALMMVSGYESHDINEHEFENGFSNAMHVHPEVSAEAFKFIKKIFEKIPKLCKRDIVSEAYGRACWGEQGVNGAVEFLDAIDKYDSQEVYEGLIEKLVKDVNLNKALDLARLMEKPLPKLSDDTIKKSFEKVILYHDNVSELIEKISLFTDKSVYELIKEIPIEFYQNAIKEKIRDTFRESGEIIDNAIIYKELDSALKDISESLFEDSLAKGSELANLIKKVTGNNEIVDWFYERSEDLFKEMMINAIKDRLERMMEATKIKKRLDLFEGVAYNNFAKTNEEHIKKWLKLKKESDKSE